MTHIGTWPWSRSSWHCRRWLAQAASCCSFDSAEGGFGWDWCCFLHLAPRETDGSGVPSLMFVRILLWRPQRSRLLPASLKQSLFPPHNERSSRQAAIQQYSLEDRSYQNQKELGSSLLPSSSPLRSKGLKGQLTSLPWHWDHAELVQQAQCVHLEPMLDALAAD